MESTLDMRDWIAKGEHCRFTTLCLSRMRFSRALFKLPGLLHVEPADRIIIATAIIKGFSIVTKDERIQKHPRV